VALISSTRRNKKEFRVESVNMKLLQQSLAVLVSSCLALAIVRDVSANQAVPSVSAPAVATQQTPEALQQLVAPIALYPDSLVAQILSAAAYPVEIVEADRWLQAHPELTGSALADEVNKQDWDPSVKALTEFSSVLANMDQNLAWTSSLGDAYIDQPAALMTAVQTMRQRAADAGNLNSTSQETVTTQAQTIGIEPTDPDVVYLPQYDPWLAYGAPVAVWPGWYPYSGLYLDGPGIAFGVGLGVGIFAGYGWGWRHWSPDWHHHAIMYNHGAYVARGPAGIDHDRFLREHGNFHGNPGFRSFSAPQRALAGLPHPALGGAIGRFGGFGHENFGVENFGHENFGRGNPRGGRFGFGEMGHAGAGFHGGGFHGGGGHGGRG
jgi:Protein of unknown function (DUF3300)